MKGWTWHQFYTYVKLKPGTNVQQLQDKVPGSYEKGNISDIDTRPGSTFLPFFQPLKDIHLKSADFIYDNAVRGNQTYVKALTIIALFVLVIACFNFVNLATARSFRRAKEIGVRKVIGAERKQLIIQFIGETILLSVLSMLLAIVGTFLIVPLLNQFTGKSIQFNPFANPILGLIILTAGNCHWYGRRYLSRLSVIRFSTDKSFKEHETYWQWKWRMVKTSVGCDPILTFCAADRFYNYCLQANPVFK
jgi:putative ABC transport system permease protein